MSLSANCARYAATTAARPCCRSPGPTRSTSVVSVRPSAAASSRSNALAEAGDDLPDLRGRDRAGPLLGWSSKTLKHHPEQQPDRRREGEHAERDRPQRRRAAADLDRRGALVVRRQARRLRPRRGVGRDDAGRRVVRRRLAARDAALRVGDRLAARGGDRRAAEVSGRRVARGGRLRERAGDHAVEPGGRAGERGQRRRIVEVRAHDARARSAAANGGRPVSDAYSTHASE